MRPHPFRMAIFDNMQGMKKILFLAVCLPWLSLHAQLPWQQEVNYVLDASLDDTDNSLRGFARIEYVNHSPDTLRYIWFHLWPNALKTDRTAFSDQLLENGRMDFYFSNRDQRGYINRLDFRVDGRAAETEDHPEFIDVEKLLLPEPLPPGGRVNISTSFYEKIPSFFSGGGHLDQSYYLWQWYPKPAVYDQLGWHPMTYLDQGGGGAYGDYGRFEVRITLPANYVVAATGDLQNEEEKKWLLENRVPAAETVQPHYPTKPGGRHVGDTGHHQAQQHARQQKPVGIPSASTTKTLLYSRDHVQDFAWIADKNFLVTLDSLRLPSGEAVEIWNFFKTIKKTEQAAVLQTAKEAIRQYTTLTGICPYHSLGIVETDFPPATDKPYPLLALLQASASNDDLARQTVEQIGSSWLLQSIGPNLRHDPWMSAGLQDYFRQRIFKKILPVPDMRNDSVMGGWFNRKLPADPPLLALEVQIREKADQPVSTSAAELSKTNYNVVRCTKTGRWLQNLEKRWGASLFDTCMQAYFRNWQFRHPGPGDFRAVLEKTSGLQLGDAFALLDKKGPLPADSIKRPLRPAFLFSMRNSDKVDYINFGPAIGYNVYDRWMIGALIHNYNLPPDRFQFVLAPLYATNSKQFNGLADLSYTWHTDAGPEAIRMGLAGSRFSSLSGVDSNGNKIFGGFYKITPSLRVDLAKKSPRSSLEKWIGFKTYLIGEKGFSYSLHNSDSLYYPAPQSYGFRYLNQLDVNWRDDRVLYPYSAQVQLQQGSEFYRLNLTGNYFFNYGEKGGLQARFFAAKFGYMGPVSSQKTFETSIYQPKLTAVRGDEDYTYSNYFAGRNESEGLASQQIMMRDGGLKLRTDLFQGLQGRSDNWIASMNFNSSLPPQLIPAIIPLKIFLDVGTYAEAWGDNPPTSRFLYVAGLQLSLVRGLINIYAPILYSSDFSDNLKTVPEENSFWKKISFSIDVQNLDYKKIRQNILHLP